MSATGPFAAIYGDPCRGCGFSWSAPPDEVAAILAGAPARLSRLLAGHDGSESVPDLAWSAVAYVAHMADNTRIWSERWAASALGARSPSPGYDEEALGRARSYKRLPLSGALWSLGRAVGDWQAASALEAPEGTVLEHGEFGPIAAADIARTVAHELFHHERDVARILEG